MANHVAGFPSDLHAYVCHSMVPPTQDATEFIMWLSGRLYPGQSIEFAQAVLREIVVGKAYFKAIMEADKRMNQ